MKIQLRLRNPQIVPPGGFQWFCAETGKWYGQHNNSMASGLREKTEFYRANNFPITLDFARQFEQDLCNKLGPEYCQGFDPATPLLYPNIFDPASLKQGAATLFHAKARALAQGKWVALDQETINNRASICSRCPYNDGPSQCSTCHGGGIVRDILTGVSKLVANCPTTPYDAKLKACRICSCPLRSKICMPVDIIKQYMPESQIKRLPEHCWIITP